jgi:hypothetical protein
VDHTLRIGWFEYDDKYFSTPEMYVETHLRELPLHKRLWYAIRYICGKKSRFGCFGETVLHDQQVTQLRDMCNRFLKEYEKPINETLPKKG